MAQLVGEGLANETAQFDYEKRRYNDTVTWLAEVLPGHMRTPFEYTFDGRELYADDGSGLGEIFDEAIRRATYLPAYEKRRRLHEKDEYLDMLAMMRGELPNTMVVISDFPPELMQSKTDVGGYNASRKQTMMRIIFKTPAGTLKMYSQSLDLSDRQALEAIYGTLGYEANPGELLGQRIHEEVEPYEQEFLIDKLMGVYDRSMSAKYRGQWYAGRQDKPPVNTYDFVRQQNDLLKTYLASSNSFTGGDKDYNLAAAMEARYLQHRKTGQSTAPGYYHDFSLTAHLMAQEEMRDAGTVARQTGAIFSGCGATIGTDSAQSMITGAEQLDKSGYGNKADKLPDDRFGSRYFNCPNGHPNVRKEKNKLLPHCQTRGCKAKVSCK